MMRFHWPISNLTFFRSAENEYNQFSWVIFTHSIIQENWKIELAESCMDRGAFPVLNKHRVIDSNISDDA